MKFRLIWLPFLLFPIWLPAQFDFELGAAVGRGVYQGDLTENAFPDLEETRIFFNVFGLYHLHPEWAFRLDAFYTRISGDDRNFDDPAFSRERRFSFESDIAGGGIRLEWEPFARQRFPSEFSFRPIFSPYLHAGIGLMHVDPDPDFGPDNGDGLMELVAKDLRRGDGVTRFSVPIGGGVRLDLSRTFSAGLQLTTHYAFTDYLDGVSFTGNPDANDWLWTGGIELRYRFGLSDWDGDGVVNKFDDCPRQAGLPISGGCPDMDLDGVPDDADPCPEEAGSIELGGCPDADGDGLIDRQDACPASPGPTETRGCPDYDGDMVPDSEDMCPAVPGLPRYQGCPDSDGDGIPDPDDECPQIAGTVADRGCLPPDTDGDGLIDRLDNCPKVAGRPSDGGCPDADQDGIIDFDDKCPNAAGLPQNQGCPEVSADDLAFLAYATTQISFSPGSDILDEEALRVLDRIVEIIRTYPTHQLIIRAYTDSRGNPQANQQLSERRAEACYDYFLYRGIGPDRMIYRGMGQQNPIAPNDTAEGRERNRRVEFELRLPD
ncbi:MAG: DUF6089 family protein [Saprospiraceae bacterium]|nr:DUF6089 family protein [Saprospiraceae bacterium]